MGEDDGRSFKEKNMGYDRDFFADYAEYLLEDSVRESHDTIFQIFNKDEDSIHTLDVLDLGCGMGEFPARVAHHRYLGVDLENQGMPFEFLQADYKKLDFLDQLPFEPNLVVSLFSIEACLPATERYALYNALFERLPTVGAILSAGFFYESKKDQETVEEADGTLISYQTTESFYKFKSEIFDEKRIQMRTPSKLFGPDVVEVWKILERRE